ncbi:hypothetical protein HKBW3S33_01438 [Candidatus Hakubella thermalkaliphila]|uniref:Glycosyltransferase RgtA/B/C/D-like domain-containing protein n=1 Tax=Candidatus Hakubella thermalkaliphila TaxID=2754717 RepID=A0A6V8PAS1_9ACTN|nr:hypothetical protein HKBW3S33_01438 [Candidatus Hakubella thermalkaliphila]
MKASPGLKTLCCSLVESRAGLNPRRNICRKIYLSLFLSLLTFFILTAPGAIHEADGISMYEVTKSIIEKGDFSVPSENVLGTPGLFGKSYSPFGIGQSILAIPLYVLGKVLAAGVGLEPRFMTKFTVSLFNPIVTALTCILISKFCQRFGLSLKTSIPISILYGLGTMAWNYSKTFFSDPLAGLLILGSAYIISLSINGKYMRNIALSGILLGVAVTTRIASIVAIPAFLIYLWSISPKSHRLERFLRSVTLFSSIITFFLILVGVYNYVRFGSIFNTGYTYEYAGFETPLLQGLYGFLLSSGRSVFLFNPILILALIPIPKMFREHRKEFILFSLIVVSHLILYSTYRYWHSNPVWGPRYMLVAVPYLMILVGFLLENLKTKGMAIMVAFLVILSFFIQVSSVLVIYQRYYYDIFLKYEDSYLEKIIYEPRYSPLIGQWREIEFVRQKSLERGLLKAMAQKQLTASEPQFESSKERIAHLLQSNVFYNSFHFWLLYLYYFGFPLKMIIGIFSVLLLYLIRRWQ